MFSRLWRAPPIDILPLYDDPPGPSADDLIIDPQYPVDLSRRSSKNEDGVLFLTAQCAGNRLPVAKILKFQHFTWYIAC